MLYHNDGDKSGPTSDALCVLHYRTSNSNPFLPSPPLLTVLGLCQRVFPPSSARLIVAGLVSQLELGQTSGREGALEVKTRPRTLVFLGDEISGRTQWRELLQTA